MCGMKRTLRLGSTRQHFLAREAEFLAEQSQVPARFKMNLHRQQSVSDVQGRCVPTLGGRERQAKWPGARSGSVVCEG